MEEKRKIHFTGAVYTLLGMAVKKYNTDHETMLLAVLNVGLSRKHIYNLHANLSAILLFTDHDESCEIEGRSYVLLEEWARYKQTLVRTLVNNLVMYILKYDMEYVEREIKVLLEERRSSPEHGSRKIDLTHVALWDYLKTEENSEVLHLYFDTSQHAKDDINEALVALNNLYKAIGGDELVIEEMSVGIYSTANDLNLI